VRTAPHGSSTARPAVEPRHIGGRDLTSWSTPLGRSVARAGHRLAAWVGPHLMLLITLAVGAVVASALTGVAAEVYESVVQADGVAALDHPVLDAAVSARSATLNAAVTAYTTIGGPVGMPILATVVTLLLARARRSWTPVVLMLAACGGSLAMTIAGKVLIGRTRPPLAEAVPPYESSASFPSGHSLNAVVVAGVIAYLLVQRQERTSTRAWTVVAAVLFATTMGLTRVFLGHHWLTDVLAAWALGLAWLALVITAHRLFLTVWHRPGQDPSHDVGPDPQRQPGTTDVRPRR
jgi:undecaprenyl-diphosphatase